MTLNIETKPCQCILRPADKVKFRPFQKKVNISLWIYRVHVFMRLQILLRNIIGDGTSECIFTGIQMIYVDG